MDRGGQVISRIDTTALGPERRALLAAAREVAAELGLRAWLVGGPVRDLILGRTAGDLDLAIEGDAARFAARLAERTGGAVTGTTAFGTAKVVAGQAEVDLATARSETYPAPGALPVVRPGSVDDDLRRRDFSINAIALDLGEARLEDPYGGLADLEARRIRILHDRSFVDDPTRIYRAIRLATRLGFELEPHTRELLETAIRAGALETVSRERLWRELRLAMSESGPAAAIEALAAAGALDALFEELRPAPERFRCLEIAEGIAADDGRLDREALVLGALLARPPASLPGSGLGSERLRRVALTIAHDEIAKRAREASGPEEAMRALDEAPPELLALLGRHRSLAAAVAAQKRYRDEPLPFSARELEAGEGPHVGAAIRDARRAVALDRIAPDAALAFARERALEYLHSEKGRDG